MLTESQRIEFNKACEPLMEWLSNNIHPMAFVLISQSDAELVEGICIYNNDKFVKD